MIYPLLIIALINTGMRYGGWHVLLFIGLWMPFVVMMLGLPSIIATIRCAGYFDRPEKIYCVILAQSFWLGLLAGILALAGMQSAAWWFLLGGVMRGLTVPKGSLREEVEEWK